MKAYLVLLFTVFVACESIPNVEDDLGDLDERRGMEVEVFNNNLTDTGFNVTSVLPDDCDASQNYIDLVWENRLIDVQSWTISRLNLAAVVDTTFSVPASETSFRDDLGSQAIASYILKPEFPYDSDQTFESGLVGPERLAIQATKREGPWEQITAPFNNDRCPSVDLTNSSLVETEAAFILYFFTDSGLSMFTNQKGESTWQLVNNVPANILAASILEISNNRLLVFAARPSTGGFSTSVSLDSYNNYIFDAVTGDWRSLGPIALPGNIELFTDNAFSISTMENAEVLISGYGARAPFPSSAGDTFFLKFDPATETFETSLRTTVDTVFFRTEYIGDGKVLGLSVRSEPDISNLRFGATLPNALIYSVDQQEDVSLIQDNIFSTIGVFPPLSSFGEPNSGSNTKNVLIIYSADGQTLVVNTENNSVDFSVQDLPFSGGRATFPPQNYKGRLIIARSVGNSIPGPPALYVFEESSLSWRLVDEPPFTASNRIVDSNGDEIIFSAHAERNSFLIPYFFKADLDLD